ncbi:hypothetical protein P9850_12180 [Anoxybacillus rupiensis]|uniref:Uncharacterized protein n=1 Tax=Anoxybacteroides rupiense TaxID=311460 RepID=A0ABD5IW66_9BACL|nr:hypothetical protein [Anoxybacillus rupiensis]
MAYGLSLAGVGDRQLATGGAGRPTSHAMSPKKVIIIHYPR